MFDPEMEVLVVDDAGAMRHTPFNAQTLTQNSINEATSRAGFWPRP